MGAAEVALDLSLRGEVAFPQGDSVEERTLRETED